MKNNVTIAVLGITTAVTVVGALTAPTVVHQIAVFAGGSFSVLVVLAVCVATNIGTKPLVVENSKEMEAYTASEALRRTTRPSTAYSNEVWICNRVRLGRQLGLRDEEIAEILGLDIDVVSTIK